jgi:methylglutaconyl-CoA hydratase
MPTTIAVETAGRVARLTLDRPQVHNAFNADMIRELRATLAALRADEDVRVVVLSGRGRSFCAGADLNWMREIIRYSYEQNLEESLALADFLYELYAFPKPTVARVAGAAIGGGAGFLSACDIAVAEEGAQFGLSEVRIGLVPACIAPYVVRRTGEGRARLFFLTGERFDAGRAAEIGLVDAVAPAGGLDAEVDAIVGRLLSSGPEALTKCKELLRRVPGMDFAEAKRYTAEMIAGLRVSPEGQEGMAAFLEKRKARWAE